MQEIRSAQNPLIKELKALADKKGREAAGEMLVEGEVMLGEAVRAGLTPRCVLVEEKSALLPFAETLGHRGAAVYAVPRFVVEAVCGTKTPQGVCAAVPLPQPAGEPGDRERLVALDGVQDPGNVGTICRTADAAGFDGLLLGRGCADPYSPKVQRAAMGSGFRVPMWERAPLADSLRALRAAGFTVVASSLTGEPFYSAPLPREKVALVIGSEAHGVSPEVMALADCRLRLPMRGRAESLNAAVAAGIMMYELTRGMGE